MRSSLKRASLLLLLLAAACSSQPRDEPATPAVVTFERNAANALRLARYDDAKAALTTALAHYEAIDDLPGQWRIHLMRARLAIAQGDLDTARAESTYVSRLGPVAESDDARYQAKLLEGQVSGDQAAFREALNAATTSIERAVALTYLGRASEAIALLGEGVDQPADRAFVYYRYASQTDDAALFHKALEAYRLARDSRGIGDTLFSLAKLSRENGDTGEARHYAQRAIHALSASGDTARADTIKAWLDAQ